METVISLLIFFFFSDLIFSYFVSFPLLLAWSSSAVHLSGMGKEFCCVLTFTSSCELHFLVGIGITWKTGLFILLFFFFFFLPLLYPSALHLVLHSQLFFCLFCSVTMYAIAAVHTVYRGNHELVVCICLFAPLGSYQTVVTVLHYAGQPLPGASTAVPVLALTWELRWCHRSHGWESPFSFTPSTHPSRWAACIPKQANDCKNPH